MNLVYVLVPLLRANNAGTWCIFSMVSTMIDMFSIFLTMFRYARGVAGMIVPLSHLVNVIALCRSNINILY